MDGVVNLAMLFKIVGGLSIFLLGMKHMSEGIQAIAGRRLRRMIGAVTDNRFMACFTGATVTALIQSSSITTVMLVGFVNAGVMTLKQSIGVILGADIGTTITAWIVSLNVLQYGLPLLGIAGFVYLFSKSDSIRYGSMLFMGIGMIFFGLEIMKVGLDPLRDAPGFIAFFSRFQPDTYVGILKCVVVGALVTAVIQSSSATVAITLTLARSEVIDFETSVALVLGQNIGTTITAFLASLGASTAAKRVAWAHILTKVIGVLVMTLVFYSFVGLLSRLLGDHIDIAKRVALTHTVFNLVLVALFLPFVTPLCRLLMRIIPEPRHAETPHLTYLDVRMLDTPAFGMQQSLQELLRMADRCQSMFDDLRQIIQTAHPDEKQEQSIFEGETALDHLQNEIVQFLSQMMRGNISREISIETRKQIRMADEYESISDYLAGVLKLCLRCHHGGFEFSEHAIRQLLQLHDHVAEFTAMITLAVREGNADIMVKVRTEDEAVTHLFRELRQENMNRLVVGTCQAAPGMIFADMLQSYRKLKDHALNIAEAFTGEK